MKLLKALAISLVLSPAYSAISIAEGSNIDQAKEEVFNLFEMLELRNSLLGSRIERPGLPKTPESELEPDPLRPISQRAPVEQRTKQAPQFDAYEEGVRNPFAMTGEIAQLAYEDNQPVTGYTKQPFTDLGGPLPKLTLKGVVFKASQPDPIALLEIAGFGVYMVKVGDKVSIDPRDPKKVIQIKQISRLNVIVEVGTLGDLIIVR